MASLSCNYCGIEFYNNIDSENMLCCDTCFKAKNCMSKVQFLNWVKRVYIHSISNISAKTVGMLTDELATTLVKCFMAQEDIMNSNLSPEKHSEAAHKAQELNARRNKLIRAIDAFFGLENSHTSKTYDTSS